MTIITPPIICPFSQPHEFWILKKTLYGLQCIPRNWLDKLTITLRYLGMISPPNYSWFYTSTLAPGGGQSKLAFMSTTFLLYQIQQGGGNFQGVSLLNTSSRISGWCIWVPGNAIWVFHISNRLPISPYVSVRIRRAHLQMRWYCQQKKGPTRHTILIRTTHQLTTKINSIYIRSEHLHTQILDPSWEPQLDFHVQPDQTHSCCDLPFGL